MAKGMRRTSLAVVGCLAPLLSAEAILRLRNALAARSPVPEEAWVQDDADLGWRPIPGQVVPDAYPGIPVKLDASGFRIGNDPAATTGARRQVFAVGDSFTFGHGVRGEEAWPALLERQLAGRMKVLNLGVPAYGLGQMMLWLSRHADRIRSGDVVVLALIGEDISRIARPFSAAGRRCPLFRNVDGRLVREPGLPSPGCPSFLVRFLAARWAPDPERDPGPAGIARLLLREIDSRVRGAGGRPCFLLLPRAEELARGRADARLDVVRDEARAGGIPCLDGFQAFARLPGGGAGLYLAGDGHPSPRGHAVIAGLVADVLEGLE